MALFKKAAAPAPVAVNPVLESQPVIGPKDITELPAGWEGLDLGSLLLSFPPENFELQIQMDENTGEIHSIILGNAETAVEVSPFAATKDSDSWQEKKAELLTQLPAANLISFTETELVVSCEFREENAEEVVSQANLIKAYRGERWVLMARFVGTAAEQPVAEFENFISGIYLNRGKQAIPPGQLLPMRLPAEVLPADG